MRGQNLFSIGKPRAAKGILAPGLLLLCLLCPPPPSFADEPTPLGLEQTAASAVVNRDMAVLEDAKQELTPEKVLTPEVQQRFALNKEGKHNFGFSRSAWWFHLKLANTGSMPRERILTVSYPLTGSVELFRQVNGKLVKQGKAGIFYPFSEWAMDFASPAFTLTVPQQNGAADFYVRVRSNEVMETRFTLATPSAFQEYRTASLGIMLAIVGAWGVMIVYNLFLLISLRDRNYLIYLLENVFTFLAALSLKGAMFQYIYPASPYWGLHGLFFYVSLFQLFIALFAISFVETWRTAPRTHRFAVWYCYYAVFFICMVFAYPDELTVARFTFVNIQVVSIAVYSPLIEASIRGSRQARIMLAATLCPIVGSVAYEAGVTGYVDENILTENGAILGWLFEMLILSLALADRVKTLQAEKAAAQQTALEHERIVMKTAVEARATLEREVAERTAQLKESQSRFRQFSEATFEGIAIHDGGLILDLNETAARIMGYQPAELIGKNGLELLIRPEYRAIAQEYIENRKSDVYEVTAIRKDGSPVYLELRGRAAFYQGREVLITAVRDISERKAAEAARTAAEEATREALSRLQKIASRVPGIVYQLRMRPDGGISVPYASDAAHAIYRLNPEDLREDASQAFTHVHPDDVEAHLASIMQSARDLAPWNNEYRLKFGDEPDIWLLGNATPEREADGSILWHGFITDITERKRTAEAVRKSEERWKFAVEGSRAGIFDWNIQTGTAECSEQWKEIFGIEGRSLDECISRTHPDDVTGVLASLQDHFDGKTPTAEHEYRIMDGNGGWKWVLGRGLVVGRDADGKALRIVGTITDITERKRAEMELRQAKEQAENATRLKDKFVSLVTHDLRGPLGSLKSGLETLHKSDDLSPADQMFVGKMADHSRELLKMTERLLDLSRLQTGKIVPRKRFINCRVFAAAQMALFRNMASQKKITVLNELPETMKVYADPDLFGECVKNLLSNALKFCNNSDTVTVYNPPGMPSTIAVKDDGPGMTPKTMGMLFRQDMKMRSTGTAGEKGAGIGLLHVKELMEVQGGAIAVESERGKGCVFFLTLPATFNVTVLVVDDQETARMAIRKHCASIFPGILEAENGVEALKIIKNVTPHLIITDISMPVMDGLEFIRQVRNDGSARRIPIIAMTSDDSLATPNGMDIRSYCLHIGADDFVNKPVTAGDLVPRLGRLLQDDARV